MRIAILGSGNVAKALASGFRQSGHDVVVASREPGRGDLQEWAASVGVDVGDHATAADGAEVVCLATAWDGVEGAIALAGSGLDGKVLIDVTNPLVFDGELKLGVGHTTSGGEQVQTLAPGASVVKAFNTVGLELMYRPRFVGSTGTMFIAGDSS